MATRETARATIDVAKRQISSVNIIGATVRAAVPGSGLVTVHIDGDPPGQATPVAAAEWEFFDVGQRVLVELFPPSGAAMIGPIGPAAPWSPYPTGYDAWTSSDRSTPTISQLTLKSDTPAGSTTTTASITMTTGRLVVILVSTLSTIGGPAAPTVGSILNNGTQMGWRLRVQRTQSVPSAGGNVECNVEIWEAYSYVTQTATVTLNWSGDTTGARVVAGFYECTNALAVQAGATGSSYDVGEPFEVSVTTLFDHSHVLIVAAGAETSGSGGWSLAADTGATELTDGNDTYRAWWQGRTSAGITTPSVVTRGFNENGTAAGATFVMAGLEIVGTPNSPAIGNGSLTAAYRLKGKSLELRLGVAAGSTTTFGGGALGFRLPPGMVASALPVGGIQSISGILRPASTNRYRLMAEIASGASYFDKIIYQDAAVQYMDSTHPIALTSSMLLSLGGVIEIA